MLKFEVANRKELHAAIRAAASPSFAEAKENPVRIQWGRCRMSFPEGISETRAAQLIKNSNALHTK